MGLGERDSKGLRQKGGERNIGVGRVTKRVGKRQSAGWEKTDSGVGRLTVEWERQWNGRQWNGNDTGL